MARIGTCRAPSSRAAASNVPSPPTTTARSAFNATRGSSEASIFLLLNHAVSSAATRATLSSFGLVTMTTFWTFILFGRSFFQMLSAHGAHDAYDLHFQPRVPALVTASPRHPRHPRPTELILPRSSP